jgi:ribosome-associated protein
VPKSVAEKARLSARAALDKRAQALQVLDLAALSGIADYFVLCTGSSTTHVQTIAEAIEAALKAEGYRALHREGVAASGWLLLDYGDVVVHVFLPETRAFYALDRLWGDAPELPIEA